MCGRGLVGFVLLASEGVSMTKQVWRVEEGTQVQRLDVYITTKADFSRSAVQGLIKKEQVLLNGKPTKANVKVTAGDEIFLEVQTVAVESLEAENIPLDVLYEDTDIIIVNKARGMVVHPAVGNYQGTLVNALMYHCKDLSGINGELRPGIVHRLDKDTSGVMVAAKTDAAHLGLAEQIKAHSAVRSYYALVHGNIVENKGTIQAPIGRNPKDRLKMAVVFANSKEATTHFRVIERYGKYTLVECILETGRTHQIRVHMAYIGHSVINDPLYGYRKDNFPIQGQALHSRTLDVVHPITAEKMHIEAPLPQDFLDCISLIKSL